MIYSTNDAQLFFWGGDDLEKLIPMVLIFKGKCYYLVVIKKKHVFLVSDVHFENVDFRQTRS